MEFLFEILINGVKNFGVEIVVLVLLAVFWRLFPRARSLVKKDDTEEAQKLETERIKLEVERQVQDKKLEEERLKAEAKKQEEEPIKAKEAQRKIQDMQDQCNLGEMYYDSEDYEKALYHYRQAADQGHADAQYHLGLMYYNGYGVQQNYDKAVKWYCKAAEQGHVEAQYTLGDMYMFSNKGVKRDYEEALKWFRKASEQGHAKAQNGLGILYENGCGVPQDYEEAVKWYRKAAEQGDAAAQKNLQYIGKGLFRRIFNI